MVVLAIGTGNKAKIQALEECMEHLHFFHDYKIVSFSVPSGVSEQPMSMACTIQGAKNRAYNAFSHSSMGIKYSFGIESGLIEAPGTQTGFLHTTICCIYDGERYYTGSSTGFEIPEQALQKIIVEKLDLTEACLACGISANQNLGEEEGIVGILSRGRVNRMEYTKECIQSAFLQIVNLSLYCGESQLTN